METVKLNEAIVQVANNNYSNLNNVTVREHTPKILCELGVKDLPMQMTYRHLAKAVNEFQDGKHDHGIDAHTLEMIPFAIVDPVFVFDSDKKDDTIVVVTDLYDQMGQPIMVCIKVCGYALDGSNVNFITSIYGKRKEGIIGQFNRALNDYNDRLLYCNKGKWAKMQIKLHMYANRSLDYEYCGQTEYGDKGFMFFSTNAEVAETRANNKEN